MTDSNRFARRRLLAIVVIAGLLIGASAAYLNRGALKNAFQMAFSSDYEGPGSGTVTIEIAAGSDGTAITRQLVQAQVVKDFGITYKYVVNENPTFYPGTFNLKRHMSTKQAIAVLTNPDNAVHVKVTIKEGLRLSQVFKELHKATGIEISAFETQAKNLSQFGLPIEAPSLGGYLFPATYSFEPKVSAKQVIEIMVARMFDELDKFSVAQADRHQVLTLAAIIQKEARQTADFYKVSRVFTNRLKISMPLQSDATVSYGSGGSTVTTTDAERADPNGYNTYVHKGLPIGPISAPGALAIEAALHPVSGTWLYFCAINLKTGETVFSTTISEHDAAVAKFRKWIQENPGWNG